MQQTLIANQMVPVIGTPITAQIDPVTRQPIPGTAVLSNCVYTSSDPSIFTVAPDPNVPNGAIITTLPASGGASTSATMTETATATELDGTVSQVQGVVTIIVTPLPPPPPVTVGLAFTFGTPVNLAPTPK